MKQRIEVEIAKKVEQVANTDQSDADFTAHLLAICTLNLMLESHRDAVPPIG